MSGFALRDDVHTQHHTETSRSPLQRTKDWLMPTSVTGWTMAMAVASLITQIGIIVTGGAVRLTESGLGCPTWPKCTPESLTNTPEMGIHGYIEFGNRTLTFVLTAVAVLMLLAIWRLRATYRAIFWLSIILLCGIPGQAVIGGTTVLTELNPWVVSLHFLLSSFLVCLAALLVNRVGLERRIGGGEVEQVPSLVDGETTATTRGLARAAFVLGWITLILGTVVTGSGPHGGDAEAPRHDFDPAIVTRWHVIPVYLLIAVVIVLLVLVHRLASSQRQRISVWAMVAVIVLQASVGYYQHFNGLPIVAVLGHMLGTGLLAWLMTNMMDRQCSSYSWHDTVVDPRSPRFAANVDPATLVADAQADGAFPGPAR
ncbi:COX15/CtaA family protein [Auritidibacter ignavus]|uniref:COX15/CtaA family protein n=1 Tax=Auritidibacter ignavus TaxID=678932 RepID=UPI00244A7D4E|nr:COX15/CtaA family protein [Auritidibacter ignavus]WGH84346.1 COX15/CtaA family protein [Auritidibacter ignavus]